MLDTRIGLPSDARSAREAREFVSETLSARVDLPLIEVATLLVSELVSNAVVHAQSPIELRLRLRSGVLHVDVSDGTTEAPEKQHPGPLSINGRGLVVVDALADQWGVAPAPGGKVVWFEVAGQPSEASAPRGSRRKNRAGPSP